MLERSEFPLGDTSAAHRKIPVGAEVQCGGCEWVCVCGGGLLQGGET